MWLNWTGSPARHFHSASLRPSIFPAVIIPEGRLTRWALFKRSTNLNTATVEHHKCDCKENATEWKCHTCTFVNRRLLCNAPSADQVCVPVPVWGMNTSNHCTWEAVWRSKAAKSNFFKLSLPRQQSAFLVLLTTTLSLEDSFSVSQPTNPSFYKGK